MTITSTAKGADAKAIEVGKMGINHTDTVFELHRDKVKYGSTITINGKVFEFMKPKAADADEDEDAEVDPNANLPIYVDLEKGDVNEALMNAINEAVAAGKLTGVDNAYIEDGNLHICSDSGEAVEIKFENGHALTLQIGDTSDSYNQLKVSIQDTHTWSLGIDTISISNQDSAGDAIDVIKAAINTVSDIRGTLGATQNRLDHTINNLSVMTENIQDAESTIRDTDIAEEMMAYTKNNILIQSAQAMLAQANQVPQGVLQLLQ